MACQRGTLSERDQHLVVQISLFTLETCLTYAQIIYTAIVGFVMLAAILEWFLWLAAFMYCLVKVFQKAEHWTVRILAILVGFVFCLLR
jgi:hypothetical protein